MKLLRDPLLHFLVVLVAGPIVPIVATSLWPSNVLAARLGWIIAACLIGLFSLRALLDQWRRVGGNLKNAGAMRLRWIGALTTITVACSVAVTMLLFVSLV